jgi:hypothetical protein
MAAKTELAQFIAAARTSCAKMPVRQEEFWWQSVPKAINRGVLNDRDR